MREHITRLLPATASWLCITVAHLPAPEDFQMAEPNAIAELMDLEDWNWLEDGNLFEDTIANKELTQKENFLLSPNPTYPSVGISHQNSAEHAAQAEVPREGYSIVLDPYHITTLSAELPAEIIKVTKKIGDSVARGELLIEQDSRVYFATYEKAIAAVNKAQTILEGQRELYKENLASLFDLKEAEAGLATALADEAIAKKALDSTKTFAPYDGKVLSLFAEKFELPRNTRNDNREMIQIIDDHILLGRLLLPSSLFGKIKIGQKVTIHVKETGTTISGEITRIAATIDPASSTIKVEVEINNEEGKLLSGMSGTAILETLDTSNTLMPSPRIDEDFLKLQKSSPSFDLENKTTNPSSFADIDFKMITADDFNQSNSLDNLEEPDISEEESSFFIEVLDAIEAATAPKQNLFPPKDSDLEISMDQKDSDFSMEDFSTESSIDNKKKDRKLLEENEDRDVTDLMTLLNLNLSEEADLLSEDLQGSLDFINDDMIMNIEDLL